MGEDENKVAGRIKGKENQPSEKERIKRDVAVIFEMFIKAEAGNRITQFNMMGFQNTIERVIDQPIKYGNFDPQTGQKITSEQGGKGENE